MFDPYLNRILDSEKGLEKMKKIVMPLLNIN